MFRHKSLVFDTNLVNVKTYTYLKKDHFTYIVLLQGSSKRKALQKLQRRPIIKDTDKNIPKYFLN